MTTTHRTLLGLFLMLAATGPAVASSPPFGLALHGGAGVIARDTLAADQEAAYRETLGAALEAGYALLAAGGTALDAVESVVMQLESSPLFNAGHGAVLNAAGICELDAAIMDGATRAAGAVAGVRHIEHPIRLARTVMTHSPHVLLVGAGAETFAREQGFPTVPNAFFVTPRRQEQLERARERAAIGPHAARPGPAPADLLGTVGCVALDQHGNLAAATSTGGMTNKRYGRIGDSPLIGAGTYADNATAALSATGHGEFFIRGVVAHDVAARMAYGGRSLAPAATETLAALTAAGGTGGWVAIDRTGEVVMVFNTPGMYRASRTSRIPATVEIFDAELP